MTGFITRILPLAGAWLAVSSSVLIPAAAAKEPITTTRFEQPELASMSDLPPMDCVVSPFKVVDLASPVPGVVAQVNFERSDFVEQDAVVALLASGVEQASVKLAQLRASIEAEVHLEKINLSFAERQQHRIDSLYGKKAVSYQHKDEADREAELSIWKLRQALDLVRVRELELNRALEQLEQKTVRSPITGFVVQNFKSVGEYVEDQPVLRLVQLDPLNVEAIVPMELFGKIKVGMTAIVQLETLNFAAQQAQVTIVDRMGDAASGTFGVRLALPNPNYQIPAGLKCDLKFSSETIASDSQAYPTHAETATAEAARNSVSMANTADETHRIGTVSGAVLC